MQVFAHKLLCRAATERGFAVPTVLLAALAAFALGSAAVVATIGAQGGTVRDQDSKAALAAAEAGVANALLRFNRLRPDSDALPCQPIGGTVPDANGWCPETNLTQGEIDRGTFSYRVAVRPASGSDPAHIQIVSTGTVDGVNRRVTARADTISGGFKPFENASVIGLNDITLNSNARIYADVATNGNLTLNSNAEVRCEYAQVGIGYTPVQKSNSKLHCQPVQGTVSLPPVNPGDVATNNNNGRICTLDPLTGQDCSSAWNPNTKRLTLNSNSALTLGAPGGEFNYAFCKVAVNSNAHIKIAMGARVRMYFLAPEMCNNETEPLTLNSNAKIQPTGSDPTSLAMLVVGSPNRNTRITLNSNAFLFNCEQTFVLYAPLTDLTLNSNIDVCGGVAAKSILVNSNAEIRAGGIADNWELPGADTGPAHYGEPQHFIECTPVPTGSSPDSGC